MKSYLKLIGAIFFISLVLGCVSSSPYRMQDILAMNQEQKKPESINILRLYSWKEDSKSGAAAEKCAEPFPIEEHTMEDMLDSIGWFNEEETRYLTANLSRLTKSMNCHDYVYLECKNVSWLKMYYRKDSEWDSVLLFDGTAQGITGGDAVAAKFLLIGSAKIHAGEFSFNKQGTLVHLKQTKEAEATFGGYGYTYTNADIDDEKAGRIKDGATTKDDIVNILGQPAEVKLLRDGSVVWTYEYKKFGRSMGWMFVPGGGLKKPELTEHECCEIRLKDDIVLNHNFVKFK